MLDQLYVASGSRRDKIQIYYDIIKVSTRPTKVTRLIRLANVQYNTFIECTETLIKAGLLEKVILNSRRKRDNPKEIYKATKIGLKWCEQVDDIYNSLSI